MDSMMEAMGYKQRAQTITDAEQSSIAELEAENAQKGDNYNG